MEHHIPHHPHHPHHPHMMSPYASPPVYPMSGIERPTNSDVLCGRGVTTNRHKGNENFRSLVGCNKELYVTSTKKQKMRISRSIVEAVRSLEPPGRFLEKDQSNGTWFDIGDKKAIEKTSQALRDGAASLRKQLSEDLNDPDFLSAVFDGDATAVPPPKKEAVEKSPKSGSAKKKEDKSTKKPPAKGQHRRAKSNPSIGTSARGKTLVIKKHRPGSEMPMSPGGMGVAGRPPQSPMSPRSGSSPRYAMPPPGAHHSRPGPGQSYSLPNSPVVYQGHGDPHYHPFQAPSSRSGSYEYGPEHYDRPPPRQYSSSGSPYPPPPPSPRYHRGSPHQRTYRAPPISPRWSPHAAFNRQGPSLSPHPYLHQSEFRGHHTPEHRGPPGVSPRHAEYQPHGSAPYNQSSGSLTVPFLGGERTLPHPPPPPHPTISMSPGRYPPPSPQSYHRGSPYPPTESLSIPRDFTPPHYHRRRPMSPPGYMRKSPDEAVSQDRMDVDKRDERADDTNRRPEEVKSQENHRKTKEAAPEKETISSMPSSVRTSIHETPSEEKKSDTPPAIEVVINEDKKPAASPSAVADVIHSKDVTDKEQLLLSPSRIDAHTDYPSDEDPNNPANDDDDISFSPLPYGEEKTSADGPQALMEVPDDLLKLPISPCSPHDERSDGS
eukprot:CAMPEP_0194040386 /NCGR_PEP_ID=MMETSP0009_2-20130614/12409_1 /TAXON_ID=210454 /ORGANISM="Grammatophora oceanica, Strain CCMP 410" /LENGTH=659 /DNA_ID=CAMNT_0038683523 /DNA_START=47 /DNA_END=2026 /DNA_ORIENTATION=+